MLALRRSADAAVLLSPHFIPNRNYRSQQRGGLRCVNGVILMVAAVCCTGSGFGQEEGTLHLRTTILPPEADMQRVAREFGEFHKQYMARYA